MVNVQRVRLRESVVTRRGDPDVSDVKVIHMLCKVDDKAEKPPQCAATRRIWFQTHVTVVGDMRQNAKGNEDHLPRII